jgi:hypothetical protein
MESNLDNIEIYVDGSPNSTPLHDESLLADEEFDMFDNEAESEVQHDSEEDAESRKQDIRKELRKEAQLKTKEYMNILCSMYGPKLKPKNGQQCKNRGGSPGFLSVKLRACPPTSQGLVSVSLVTPTTLPRMVTM